MKCYEFYVQMEMRHFVTPHADPMIGSELQGATL